MRVTPVWDGSQSGNAMIFSLLTMILVVDLREKVGIEDQQFGPGRKIAARALSSWDPDDSFYSLKKPRSSFPAALSRVSTSLFLQSVSHSSRHRFRTVQTVPSLSLGIVSCTPIKS